MAPKGETEKATKAQRNPKSSVYRTSYIDCFCSVKISLKRVSNIFSLNLYRLFLTTVLLLIFVFYWAIFSTIGIFVLRLFFCFIVRWVIYEYSHKPTGKPSSSFCKGSGFKDPPGMFWSISFQTKIISFYVSLRRSDWTKRIKLIRRIRSTWGDAEVFAFFGISESE